MDQNVNHYVHNNAVNNVENVSYCRIQEDVDNHVIDCIRCNTIVEGTNKGPWRDNKVKSNVENVNYYIRDNNKDSFIDFWIRK